MKNQGHHKKCPAYRCKFDITGTTAEFSGITASPKAAEIYPESILPCTAMRITDPHSIGQNITYNILYNISAMRSRVNL